MAKAAQLFSKKADVYRSGRTHYPKAIASILRELELPGNQAVDAGCGTGIFSQLLLDCGFFVYGVEPNAEMLGKANADVIGWFPEDAELNRFDRDGNPLLNLPDSCECVQAADKLLKSLFEEEDN